jgi:hypothetical protein
MLVCSPSYPFAEAPSVLLSPPLHRAPFLTHCSNPTDNNADAIDWQLGRFLEKNFKLEVREKQKANEIAAGIDRFGVIYTEPNYKCAVM